jgi:ABC-type multidrug transport system ATPase subunit
MAENIITTSAINFSFSSGKEILKNISMSVPRGSIYGFLGPNGAGKTTTLKLLLGLIKNQNGAINVFGKDLKKERIAILQKTGSLIEQPSLYLHLTAKENLEVFRLSFQADKKRIAEVLEIIGLSDTAHKKVKAFSLGMKQRLAIGIALLHDPELLILDEPSNGLDPGGIIEMRKLIIHLNEKLGKTILISSHLLSEMEKMATHVGIINKGVLLYQGEMNDLHTHKKPKLHLETSDDASALKMLENKYQVFTSESGLLLELNDKESIAVINILMVESGLRVYKLSPVQFNLEDLFMQTLNA